VWNAGGPGKEYQWHKRSEQRKSAVTMPANRNTITYREDRNGANFHASLTDDSMHSLGGVFEELFSQRSLRRTHQHGATHLFSQEQTALDASKAITAPAE
jgi:hypothetical protein